MLALLMTLSGLAFVESFNVLNLGAPSAIVYDSRLHRRSPLPGGLSFVAGLFAATAAVGITVAMGVTFVTELTAFKLTPATRYRGELIVGAILACIACYPSATQKASPRWAFTVMRRRPWLFAGAGATLGFGQAATDVVYLAALAMLSTHHPQPSVWPAVWPLMVVAYCVIELWPPLLVLFLATRRTARAQRLQRGLVRVITRYGPRWVRALCLVTGAALVIDAFLHSHSLW
ncbi:hypothetical protein MSIMFI_01802 [Mycobacterium simulans]|uniref:GAP family protein n=1 Tax=Mycobacterium simulans TaxID=627089 RepID=UPI00174E6BBE|nr:GAP family protein [Mycobacterium simulans]SON60308.1 hypothetical protein MSIMFI_01802 [Mycobacterium simulans]